MAAPRDCPEIESLQALADDTAPAGMWERYEQHVESCRACQERLDQIGAGGDALQRIGRRIGDPTAVPDDPTLSEALRRLREVRSPITPAVPEGDLSFLGPRSGGSLGTLGQYEVQEVIGRGGMGIVLKGFEAALRRPVAIKFMAPELAGSATARQRFTNDDNAV